MTREKKFFPPTIRSYGDDTRKRWRVEYWEPTHNGTSAKRVALYKAGTVEERYRRAHELIATLPYKPSPVEKNILEKVIETGTLYWRPKTISAYSTVVERYKGYLGKKRRQEQATTELIQQFLLHQAAQGTNLNTIAKYRNTLYTLYEKAKDSGLTGFNPVQKVAGIKRSPKSLYFFSDAQISRFKSVEMPTQLWLAIRLLFYCFIRPGELRLLKIEDINFEYHFIEVRGEISKNRKTQKVAIPDHFFQELQYLKDYANGFYVLSKSGQPGTVPISTKWLNDEHKKVLDTLKIRGRYAFYSWSIPGR